MSAQGLHWFVIPLCLLISVLSVTSLQCFQCSSSAPGSKCETGVKEFAKYNHSKFAQNCSDFNFKGKVFCAIETEYINSKSSYLIRECSDGETFTFNRNLDNFQKLKYLNPEKNTTLCTYRNGILCLTTCETDFCNGPQSMAVIHSHIPALVITLAIGVLALLPSY
uniref:Protein quiver n=1 Tax=Octopus bimaculoides TaxID=37653 RepID=A0A0L8G5W9_OCTBM